MEFLHTLYCQYPGMLHLYIGILGLLVGSFLNVVVYRLPVMMENEYRRDFLEYFTPDSPELKKEQPKFNLMTPRSRCPNCGHIGTVRNFLKGCPACHYAVTQEELYGISESGKDSEKKQLSRKSRKKIKKAFKIHESSIFSDDVPAWLFVASIIALIVIFAVLFMRCKS